MAHAPFRSTWIIAIVLALAACGGGSSSGDDGADPANTADTVATETSVAAETPDATIDVGTTAPEPTSDDARCAIQDGEGGYNEVGCDEAHDAEFAGAVPAPDGAAPTDEIEYDIALVTTCRDVVEQLSGESLAQFTIEAGYVSTAGPGEEFSGDIECWVQSAAVESLVGSLTEVDLPTALGEFRTLASLEPGDCYAYPDSYGSLSIVKSSPCGEPESSRFVGVIELLDGPFPDGDAFAAAEDRCVELDADSDADAFGDSIISIKPFQTEWIGLGIRSVMCESYLYADFATCLADDPEIEGLFDDPVSCREPHKLELVGLVPTPVDVLPDDLAEAELILAKACLPVIEETTGIAPDTIGSGVAYVSAGALGGEQVGDIECYATGPNDNTLEGSLVTATLDDSIIGDGVLLSTLDPGSCFVFDEGGVELGIPADCTAAEALMYLGDVRLDGDVYPGLDESRVLRTEACAALLAESGFAADPASVSGTMLNEVKWTTIGYGRSTCDASPV